MYIDNENFDKWMEKLSKKLAEIGQNLQSLINTDKVLDENDKLLDKVVRVDSCFFDSGTELGIGFLDSAVPVQR